MLCSDAAGRWWQLKCDLALKAAWPTNVRDKSVKANDQSWASRSKQALICMTLQPLALATTGSPALAKQPHALRLRGKEGGDTSSDAHAFGADGVIKAKAHKGASGKSALPAGWPPQRPSTPKR